jgi:hypothetical protein
MSALKLPSQAYLRECFDYDPASGKISWRERPLSHFKTEEDGRRWNATYPSRETFTGVSDGYKRGHIKKTVYRAHRVIWKWMTGAEPDFVDHINGRRDDNRWENLRSVSRVENHRNSRRYKSNKSGSTGVIFHKAARKWNAQIRVEGRSLHLGLYDCIDDARKARAEAEVRYGFHRNHGLPL